MQANPNKISNYYVDLAPGSSIDLGNQNGYPRIAATAPGRSVVVAQVRATHSLARQRLPLGCSGLGIDPQLTTAAPVCFGRHLGYMRVGC